MRHFSEQMACLSMYSRAASDSRPIGVPGGHAWTSHMQGLFSYVGQVSRTACFGALLAAFSSLCLEENRSI